MCSEQCSNSYSLIKICSDKFYSPETFVSAQQVLIDGPQKTTGIHRQVYLLKRLALTDIVVKIGKNSTQKKLEAAWTSEGVVAKWEATAWAKKLAAKKKRANLSDFDRFKVMVAKKQRAKALK